MFDHLRVISCRHSLPPHILTVRFPCTVHCGGERLETAALPQIFQIAACQNNLLVSRETVVTK